ncbi:MAG: cyclopropane-fatty-acyl-phospholipid synthase family protein [Noviherbaspirillum sp.]
MNMLDNTLTMPAASGPAPRSAAALLKLLARIRHGRLDLRLPDGAHLCFGDAEAGPHAHIEIASWQVFDDVLARGDIGLAEAYIDGAWNSPDLAALLLLLASNREALSKAVYGQWWRLLAARLRHVFHANSRAGSRRNIMAHYDLGNAFYGVWLDPTMSYSSALYGDDAGLTLEDAQLAKYRRILQRLDPKPGQRILEIGCGWGGFAEVAAREAGVEVLGVTLSPAQLAYAQERMRRAGLDGQVTLELRDYRDLGEQKFDHVVSIEMFEAVGERWWPAYFQALQRLLKPGGIAVVQSITIRNELFARYRRGTDFIQQHVFPGGMLPSPRAFAVQAQRAGLALHDSFAFGPDYARTLAEWAAAVERRWPDIAAQGFDERFHRVWRFYLAYCEAGFASGCTDVMQFELRHLS